MLGYGSQGRGQALNARDQGLNVIIGVREGGASWKEAQEDGFVPGETLFPIKEAIGKGTVIMNLLSDASQAETWPEIKPLITKGKTLYFAHGFSVEVRERTHRMRLEAVTDAVSLACISICCCPLNILFSTLSSLCNFWRQNDLFPWLFLFRSCLDVFTTSVVDLAFARLTFGSLCFRRSFLIRYSNRSPPSMDFGQ